MTSTVVVTDLEELRHAIVRRIAPVLRAVGLDVHEVECEVEGSVADLHVVLRGPAIATNVARALSVRVLDAVHADGRTFGNVGVALHFGSDDARR